ncbi:MAG TPA: AraC family transcriptional regulator [Polyangiaceae bacterium]|nr:AraC family transcriptional regulator [Polyangiaceae bacterium]
MGRAEAPPQAAPLLAASYVEWSVEPALRGALSCTWAAQLGAHGECHVQRIIPDGCIDLLFCEGELVIAGPDTESVELEVVPNRSIAGLRFRAGQAPAVLGLPASQLLDQRLCARDVIGLRAEALTDALSAAATPRVATAVMEHAVARWLREGAPADALVARAIGQLKAPCADWSVATLAADLGVSERQLRRRFLHAVGYGPKLLERVLRLRRFIRAAAAYSPANGLAALAAESGYADQPHLTRECRDLTALTPAQLLGYPVTAD